MAGGTTVLQRLARVLPAWPMRALGRPVAVHFHGVERVIEDSRIQGHHHARDAFYRLARMLKSDFDVLPLAALPDALKHPTRHPRSVFIMSDGGYRNVLTNAADVLDALNLPWTLFVNTHHIDTGELNPFTAARLFYCFAPAGHHLIPQMGRAIDLGDSRSRERAASKGIRKLKSLDVDSGRKAVEAMLAAIPQDRLIGLKARFQSERYLNWPQVAELAKRGVAVGSHGHHHWPMHKGRTVRDLNEEVRASKERIENQVGACAAFAYPFGAPGDVSREAWRAVRDAGYAHAFTTLVGSLDGGANPWLLPRYALARDDMRLSTLAPMLRAANPRLAYWQKRLA
jgi:peptidoglycan/xylan/chitin deacetylase (PgdA/CDA1 family)